MHVDYLLVLCNKGECAKMRAATEITKDLGQVECYGRCAYKRKWDNGTIKISRYALVEKIVDKSDITRAAPTPAFVALETTIQVHRGGSEVDVPSGQGMGALM